MNLMDFCLSNIVALTLEGSVEIEKVPGPPGPPRDPYEGGPRIELNNPANTIASLPPAPPAPASPYSMKPEGYGPKKSYSTPAYYKVPSSDVPYFETISRAPKSSYSSTNHQYVSSYHTIRPVMVSSSRVQQSIPDYHSESSSPSTSSSYNHQDHSEQDPDNQDPYSTIYHTISHITSDSNSNRPYTKEFSVSRHENGGTIINIPIAAASSERLESVVLPPSSTSTIPSSSDDHFQMIESSPMSAVEKLANIYDGGDQQTASLKLSKITRIHRPKFVNLLSKQQNNGGLKLPKQSKQLNDGLQKDNYLSNPIVLQKQLQQQQLLLQQLQQQQQLLESVPRSGDYLAPATNQPLIYPNGGLQFLLIPADLLFAAADRMPLGY